MGGPRESVSRMRAVHSPRFRGGWTALMREILSRGHRIKVIHDLNLDADEMFCAASSWIPLYISGQVEPYYLTRPNRSLFNEYIGAAEGLCSMRFSCFKGKEEEVTAFFSKSPDKAAFVSEQFGNLLACAKPLVIVSKEGGATYVIKNEAPLVAFSFLHSYMNYVIDRYLRRYLS